MGHSAGAARRSGLRSWARATGSPRRRAPRSVRPHPQAEQPEVADGSEDDLWLRPGGRARGPRVVRDADLDDRAAGGAQLDDHLGREEGAAGFDAQAFERLAAEELAGAVDVGDLEAEEDPVGQSVRARVERPDRAGRRA